MPEESKKNQHKGAKEQRKPRNRHQAGPADKKVEKKAEKSKVPVQKPPVYDEPGPEFYKNLKRETDEILKITEEANSKYKKKEIQSNWSKYEMPIESYDEIEEQENMGADYEKLIEAPLSLGGHFQFKHEKSWDVDTAPSLYDKYFEINMENLFLSIATIPFYERLDVDKSIFTETDILTMNNRATRFKQKFYNDKTFTTPELIVQDNILSSLKENINKLEQKSDNETDEVIEETQETVLGTKSFTEKVQDITHSIDINLGNESIIEKADVIATSNLKENTTVESLKIVTPHVNEPPEDDLDNFDDLILESKKDQTLEPKTIEMPKTKVEEVTNIPVVDLPKQNEPETQKNPVIESPEDLEKWLDDFLDG